jgi:hypothetical protein
MTMAFPAKIGNFAPPHSFGWCENNCAFAIFSSMSEPPAKDVPTFSVAVTKINEEGEKT